MRRTTRCITDNIKKRKTVASRALGYVARSSGKYFLRFVQGTSFVIVIIPKVTKQVAPQVIKCLKVRQGSKELLIKKIKAHLSF
jgi:hypothetical protein